MLCSSSPVPFTWELWDQKTLFGIMDKYLTTDWSSLYIKVEKTSIMSQKVWGKVGKWVALVHPEKLGLTPDPHALSQMLRKLLGPAKDTYLGLHKFATYKIFELQITTHFPPFQDSFRERLLHLIGKGVNLWSSLKIDQQGLVRWPSG